MVAHLRTVSFVVCLVFVVPHAGLAQPAPDEQPSSNPAPTAPDAPPQPAAPPDAPAAAPTDEAGIALEGVSLAELLDQSYLDPKLDRLLGISRDATASIYGFARANAEKVFHVPVRAGDGVEYEDEAHEFQVPAFHLYGVARANKRVEVLFNLFSDGEELSLRNAYGNLEVSPWLQVRLGKMYRKFGLYNEKLDDTPAFLGIEVPELFDKDHLMLPRTTAAMVHGEAPVGDGVLHYAVDTDNGEGGAARGVVPLGWDLRYKAAAFVVGTSGYVSSIGTNAPGPTKAVGEGSPDGGVMPWMDDDRYVVVGGFGQLERDRLIVEAEYWAGRHDARRNADSVLTVVREGGIAPDHRERFLGASAGLPDAELDAGDVVRDVDYTVHTFFVKAGYGVPTQHGHFTPYAILDYMKHPESIDQKDFGGDAEAGRADDGVFWKPSLGLIFRPITEVALKVDTSAHIQTVAGETTIYPEIRFDASFAFSLLK